MELTWCCPSHRQQERVVEERLRARYTLIDRSDAAAISAAQQAGVPIKDDGELVGETDGQCCVTALHSSALCDQRKFRKEMRC